MEYEDALGQLEAAIEADSGPAPVESNAPDVETSQSVDPVSTPAVEGSPEPVEVTEEAFSKIDPTALPDELQPIYKSLQADYTRKTQALAEQRKQFEAIGDLEAAQQALELRARLTDPNEWVPLYQELQEAIAAYGLLPNEEVAAGPQDFSQPGMEASLGYGDDVDPELAPLHQTLQQLQAQVESMQMQQTQALEAAQAEQQYNAIIGELQRQENAILQANPHYTDQDLDAIADIATAFGGNLLQAQQRYEEIVSSRLAAYLNAKASPGAPMSTSPIAGSPIPAISNDADPTIDSAHAAAMEMLRQLEG